MCPIPSKAVTKPLCFSSETNVSVEANKDSSGSTFRDGVVVYVWFCFGFLPNKYTGFTSNQTISVPESSWGFHLPQLISKHLHIS